MILGQFRWDFAKKNFFFEKQTNKRTNKQAKWCGHLDFWGIFLASECPEDD